MQMKDLGIKPMHDMTDEELLEKIKEIRNNQFVVKPAHVKKRRDAAELSSRRAGKSIDDLFAKMTTEERESFLSKLEELGGEDATPADDTTE